MRRCYFLDFTTLRPGFPFRGPNLEFPVAVWGGFLGRMVPATLIPWASLIVFPIVAYGIKLSGLGAMMRFEIGRRAHRSLGMVFAIVFALSFAIGTFFPYEAMGAFDIFLQPTLWILGLFSLHPIDAWLERNRGTLAPARSVGNARADMRAVPVCVQFLLPSRRSTKILHMRCRIFIWRLRPTTS